MSLTADEILAASDASLLKIRVKEWGGEVFVRVMSVKERDAYERLWIGKRETGVDNFRAEYLARVLCDESGKLLFSRDQIDALSEKSGAVMGKLFDKALKHNNMTDADVEELAKN